MVSVEPFNMRQWADEHDRRDDERFGAIFKILGVSATVLVAVLGWSLKTQYESMQKQVEQAQVQMSAIERVRQDVWTAARIEESAVPKSQH